METVVEVSVKGGYKYVPPSGGSLEIGNLDKELVTSYSKYGVPPSGGSLEIGNELVGAASRVLLQCSPFGGIPRNWKHG